MPNLPDLSSNLPDVATIAAGVVGFIAAFARTIWGIVTKPFSGIGFRLRLAWNARALHDALAAIAEGTDGTAITKARRLLERLGSAGANGSGEVVAPAKHSAQRPPKLRVKRRAKPPVEATAATQATV